MSRASLVVGVLLAWVVSCALAFAAGWAWRSDRAELSQADAAVTLGRDALAAEQMARGVERDQVAAGQRAGDAADGREEGINANYEERVAAAVAGHDGELGRLRKQWAGCETGRLADGVAAAAAAAEEDRLRRLSAARIVRACELAQSERDEAIDRYQAVQLAINGAQRP